MPHHPPATCLSPFSRSLARDLLAELVRTPIFLCAALYEAGEIDLDRDPDTRPLGEQLAANYRGVPVASTLSPEEIAASLDQGDDPWAEDLHGHPHRRLDRPPIQEMATALRLLALVPTEEDLARLLTPGNVATLIIPRQHERERVWRDMPDLMSALARVCGKRGIDWTGPEMPVYGSDASGTAADALRTGRKFAEAIGDAVAKGAPVLAIASHPRDLPEVGRVLCESVHMLPPLTREMAVEMLRITHSVTGEVAETAILERLPGDGALGSLHSALIDHAFAAGTTLRVADRLASTARRAGTRPERTLKDIALPAQVRDDLFRIVSDLGAWRSGLLDWADVSASVFLHGPPGNGKTMIASGIAGSAGVPLVATSYADCQRHGHQGDYLRAMHEHVEDAIAKAPSVFFLDELDSYMIRSRKSRYSDYNIGVVNGLLEQLSRLHETPGVIVIGAANHPHLIDPAILRPGRFDLRHEIPNPDRSGIEQILSRSFGSDAEQLDLKAAARRLVGCSGATVAATVRDAKARARQVDQAVGDQHLCRAIKRVAPKHSDDDLWRVAVHEAGHVVVGYHLTGQVPHLVRLTPGGGEVHDEPPSIATRNTARDRIASLLAGRAAEEIILGSVSSGAADDLAQATDLAFRSRHAWALEGDSLIALPPLTMTQLVPGTKLGDGVEQLLRKQASRAEEIVVEQLEQIEGIASDLLRRGELTREELVPLLSDHLLSQCGSPDEDPER